MEMAKATVSALEVVQFFREADTGTAELVLDIAEKEVEGKVKAKAAASARMAKARAGRGKGKAKAEVATQAQAPAPIRAGRVAAPSHTASSTSVESDTAISA